MPVDLPDETEALRVEIGRARQLRVKRQSVPGEHYYDVRGVDRFFEGLAYAVRAGVPIGPEIRGHQFLPQGTGHSGYPASEVDQLLQRIKMLAADYDMVASVHEVPRVTPLQQTFWGVRTFWRSLPVAWIIFGAVGVVVIILLFVSKTGT